MKYKLLKHIDNEDGNEIELGKEFELNKDFFQFNEGGRCPLDFLIREGYIEEVVEEKKIDFSKFIGRLDKSLVIKGDKYLISRWDLDISYYNKMDISSNDKLNYIECELKDLEKGDVFILKDVADKGKFDKSSFKIYGGKSNGYHFQFLDDDNDIEFINGNKYVNDKVYKFLRG